MPISAKYQPYIDKIIKNAQFFENLLKKIEGSNNFEMKMKYAKRAISYALANSTGYYSSNIIENVFLQIAQNNTVEDLSNDFKQNSYLHVMTESYDSGGHTRVVERWVESADDLENHSLVFTGYSKSQFIPKKLETAVKEKNGKVIFIDNKKSDIEKALELRKIGAEFQTVILHIHMYDFLPIIAFGNHQFKRPIVFFNHADHIFWTGVSISDMVAEIKENGKELSLKRRGVKKSFVINVPVEHKNVASISKREARKKLNLPSDKKIITTIGASYKYQPILDLNFIKIIEPILKNNKEVVCLGIGPDKTSLPDWQKAEKENKGQIYALGQIPYEKLHDYIFASDLIVDGIPFGGGTALIDAICCNRPILLINNPLGQFDYIIKSKACCKNIEELKEKINVLLYDENEQAENIKDILKNLDRENSIEAWKSNLKHLIQILPKKHSINNFESNFKAENIEDRDVFCYFYKQNEKQRKIVFKIPYILSLYKNKDIFSSKIILKLLNKEFTLRERFIQN